MATTPSTPISDPFPLPGRLALFSDPQAAVTWPAIVALPEAVQHDVLCELQARLALPGARDTPQRVREAPAISALREAHALLAAEQPEASADEVVLTVEAYVRLRDVHPERGWPPKSSVAEWLGGSWSAAARSAHIKAPPHGDSVRVLRDGDLTREEALAALRSCAEAIEMTPSISVYRRWANAPDVRAAGGQVPRSHGPFVRMFGSWSGALAAAGMLERDASATTQDPGSFRPGARRYSREELVASVREVAAFLGSVPRVQEYETARNTLKHRECSEGRRVTARPTYLTLHKHFGTWDEVLSAAGLDPLGGRSTRSRSREVRPQFSDDECLEAVRAYMASVPAGTRSTVRGYIAWQRALERPELTPAYDTAVRRLGGMRKVRRLLAQGDQAAAPTTAPQPPGEGPVEQEGP